MFRLWGKLMYNNHMIKDMTVCEESEDTQDPQDLPGAGGYLLCLGSGETHLAGCYDSGVSAPQEGTFLPG